MPNFEKSSIFAKKGVDLNFTDPPIWSGRSLILGGVFFALFLTFWGFRKLAQGAWLFFLRKFDGINIQFC